MPPGRNTGQWTTTDEAWRFTPSGASVVDFEWLDSAGTVISTNAIHTVCPTSDETYTARVTYTNCDGVVTVVEDDVLVTVQAEDPTFTLNPTCDGATATVTGVPGGTFAFNPVPSDGATIDTITGEISNGVPGTTYTVEYATTGVCAASSTETVTVFNVEDPSFSLTETCEGASVAITGDNGGTFVFNPVPTAVPPKAN